MLMNIETIYLTDSSFMSLDFIGPNLVTTVFKKKEEPNIFETVLQVEGDFRSQILAERDKRSH